jgi:uncharacterized protein YjbI with pentapeptide repeats
MTDTRITNVNMTGFHLSNVNLTDASISNANYGGMTIDGILVTDLLAKWNDDGS